jgi:hypothetical protein
MQNREQELKKLYNEYATHVMNDSDTVVVVTKLLEVAYYMGCSNSFKSILDEGNDIDFKKKIITEFNRLNRDIKGII